MLFLLQNSCDLSQGPPPLLFMGLPLVTKIFFILILPRSKKPYFLNIESGACLNLSFNHCNSFSSFFLAGPHQDWHSICKSLLSLIAITSMSECPHTLQYSIIGIDKSSFSITMYPFNLYRCETISSTQFSPIFYTFLFLNGDFAQHSECIWSPAKLDLDGGVSQSQIRSVKRCHHLEPPPINLITVLPCKV